MIPQISDIRTENKSTEEVVESLVKHVNYLNQQMQLALSNIGLESVYTESGISLEDLYAAGALKGEPGIQGPPGKVYRPAVSGIGDLSWTLTDEGGTIPATVNIKGDPGSPGAAGVGVPAGGTTGQVLRKKSDSDFDTEWVTP